MTDVNIVITKKDIIKEVSESLTDIPKCYNKTMFDDEIRQTVNSYIEFIMMAFEVNDNIRVSRKNAYLTLDVDGSSISMGLSRKPKQEPLGTMRFNLLFDGFIHYHGSPKGSFRRKIQARTIDTMGNLFYRAASGEVDLSITRLGKCRTTKKGKTPTVEFIGSDKLVEHIKTLWV